MKYIFSPEEIISVNSKIKTLQILIRYKLPNLDVKIISPNSFLDYYKNKRFTPDLRDEITSLLKSLFKENKYISIRTAVEKESELLLPRSKSLDSISKSLSFIKKTWDYFIGISTNPEDLGVSLLVHKFVPSFASGTIGSFPNQNRNIIEATYGIWEGIQSNLHDIYIIDRSNQVIINKIIPEKDIALFSENFGKWVYKKVEPELKNKQVLSDLQILEVSRQASLVENVYNSPRIEFIVEETKEQDSKEAILLWHIISSKETDPHFYKIIPFDQETNQKIYYAGNLLIAREVGDINMLRQIDNDNLILLLGDEIITKRDLFAIQLLASLAKEKNWPIIYKGGILTHINIILREYGVKVFSVNQTISLEKKVKVIEDLI